MSDDYCGWSVLTLEEYEVRQLAPLEYGVLDALTQRHNLSFDQVCELEVELGITRSAEFFGLTEAEAGEVLSAVEEICACVEAGFGIHIELGYHNADVYGGPYGEVNGGFWSVDETDLLTYTPRAQVMVDRGIVPVRIHGIT